MELLIKSFNDALEYLPDKRTYRIGIGRWQDNFDLYPLKQSQNWLHIENYYFDDAWPKEWKEYSWADLNDPYFGGLLSKSWEEISKTYPLMTKESLMSLVESKGQNFDRVILFDKPLAKKIINNFHIFGKEAECVLIHSSKGQYRSPALGIAMNETFDWKINGLKERYPDYRRYVYSTMLDAGKEMFSK